MNAIIKPESNWLFCPSLQGRAYGVVADEKTGRILNQKMRATRYFTDGGCKFRITVDLRFDDQCNNGHETFAITGSIDELARGQYREYSGGCIHDPIAEHFPELAHLIKWHLTSTDGPMHGVANALYHASDRDYNGRAAGEASRWKRGVRFGNSPITHHKSDEFLDFLKAALAVNKQVRQTNPNFHTFEPIAIEHGPSDSSFEYSPNYTFKGFGDKWHECPFDSEAKAREWQQALVNLPADFVSVITGYSKGKARDLEAARQAAVWPEATDEQLSAPRAELEAALLARLPGLLDNFKADLLATGFLWPERQPEVDNSTK